MAKKPAAKPASRRAEPANQAGGRRGAAKELATGKHPHHTVNVGLVQTHASGEAADNLERTLRLIDQAAKKGANIVCTQELFLGPYFCQEEDAANFDLAEPIPGPTTKALAAKAKQHGIAIVASLFEKRARGLYHNTAIVLDADGKLLGSYRKMHIPDDPRFYEKFYFTPGDAGEAGLGDGGWRVFDTKFGRIGVLVCWDQWYPEAARLTALQGADILFYPTAIGTWTGELEYKSIQHDAWRTIQRSHAVANNCFVAAVNRVGKEGDLVFWGGSFVSRPMGVMAAEAGDKEEVLVVACDLGEIEAARRGWPFLRDRRVDAYAGLTQRYLDQNTAKPARAHGASMLVKDNLLDASDLTLQYVCDRCGHIAMSDQRGFYRCKQCGDEADLHPVGMPYAFKLLQKELESLLVRDAKLKMAATKTKQSSPRKK